MRLELLVMPERGEPQRIPLTLTSDTTVVEELVGRPAPAFVFANARDHAYAITLLDPGSVSALERDMSAVGDTFLRAMLWGALWDLVRDALLSPERYVRMVLRELPRERDEQIASGLLARVSRATTAYLSPVLRDAYLPDVERALLRGANNDTLSYGLRKAHFDAWVRVASSQPTVDQLAGMLDSASVAGEPLRAPTRWSIVTRLLALGVPGADERLAAEVARDRTPEGARRAFIAGAARPAAETKRDYFRRYFADSALNEDWATASLDAFNTPESRALTLPFVTPALDSLPWIQRNRRIFFVGAWLSGFLDGQTDDAALAAVRDFLARRQDLPEDLRRKVLQAADELERTVRIRRTFGVERERASEAATATGALGSAPSSGRRASRVPAP